MAEPDPSGVDIEEVLKRLTLYADALFFSLAGLTSGGVLSGLGMSPDDLAMQTVLKYLDPREHTVAWNTKYGSPTTETLLSFLCRVLRNDLIDILRLKAHETTIVCDEQPKTGEQESARPHLMSLDEFASQLDGPDGRVIREQQHTHLLALFADEPELKDMLEVQLNPDGYHAYTNQDLAHLFGATVSDIENRKKRLMNRLLRIFNQMREAAAKESRRG